MSLIKYLVKQFVGGDKTSENSERTVTVTDIINVLKVRKITESDERYMIRNIVKAVGISLPRGIKF